MKFLFPLIVFVFFLGCSNKINLSEYRPYYVPKSAAAPSDFSPKVKKVSLVKFPKYFFKHTELLGTPATYKLNSLLQQSKFVKVVRVINESQINDEIKAAELAKETDSDIGADYLIKGVILSATYTPTYHKGYFYYVKSHGRKIRKYAPPYYSYEACTHISVSVSSLPELTRKYDRTFRSCAYYSDNSSYKRIYSDLVLKALDKTVFEAYESLKKHFAPKGYIYEVRKNGNDLIAKITLGSNQGMYTGLKMNIYELVKDPVTGDTEKHPIGTGEVSNVIYDNSCWITVDLEDGYELKIGDMAEPSFESSFWDMFK